MDDYPLSMSPIEFYAIAMTGVIAIALCWGLLERWRRPLRHVQAGLGKYLCRKHSVLGTSRLGSWTWWTILSQCILIGTNLLVVFFNFTDIQTAARRAGSVAVMDMVVFYLGPHLSYQADSLHLPLARMRSVHRAITWPFAIVTAFHVGVLRPARSVFASGLTQQLYGVIVGGSCHRSACH